MVGFRCRAREDAFDPFSAAAEPAEHRQIADGAGGFRGCQRDEHGQGGILAAGASGLGQPGVNAEIAQFFDRSGGGGLARGFPAGGCVGASLSAARAGLLSATMRSRRDSRPGRVPPVFVNGRGFAVAMAIGFQ